MKKLVVMLIVIAIVIMGNSYEVFLYARKIILGEPTTHTIQKGEYLSKIAQHYYGTADYWRELALVNRAPNSDRVFPGEQIIVPRKEVILNIRNARSLTNVNMFVKGEENIIAHLPTHDNTNDVIAVKSDVETAIISDLNQLPNENIIDTEPVIEEPVIEKTTVDDFTEKPLESSSLNIVLTIIGMILIGSIAGVVLYQRKKRIKWEDEFSIINEADLDRPQDQEESEPKDQPFFKDKNKVEKEIIIN